MLGFAVGSVLFVLLSVLAWRAEEHARQPYHGTRAAVLCFLWNIGSLGQFATLLFGAGYGSWAWRLSGIIAWCSIAMLPTAVLLLLNGAIRRQSRRQQIYHQGWQDRARWLFRLMSLVIAGSLTLAFTATALAPRLSIKASIPGVGWSTVIGFHWVMRLSAYNMVFHMLGELVLFRGVKRLTKAGRAYSRAMLLWTAALGLLLMVTIHAGLGAQAESVLEAVTQQSTIPVAIFSLVFLGQFRFADVFVKRSLVVFAAVVVALVYLLLVVGPAVSCASKAGSHPGAIVWLAGTILWTLLLLLFPTVERGVGRAADRWLFRRPDYRLLYEKFAADSDMAQDEGSLFALAERSLHTAVDAASVKIEAVGPDPVWPNPVWPNLAPVDNGSKAEQVGSSRSGLSIPVQVKGAIAYTITIIPAERGRRLLSGELRFLTLIADRIGQRIESLTFDREVRERELREARLRQLLAEANLKALRAQLNPHFLFNTLNTILDLIGSEPEKAETMTEQLAEVFRHIMVRTERDMVTVGEEIEFLRGYLEIERVRFGDRLIVDFDLDSEITKQPIPSLILQPLVENAIKHGLADKVGAGTIRIAGRVEGDLIHLAVEDDGVGWSGEGLDAPSPVESTLEACGPRVSVRPGFALGLRNVRERLAAVYGDQACMVISGAPGLGARVRIRIAKRDADDSSNRRRGIRKVATAETSGRSS